MRPTVALSRLPWAFRALLLALAALALLTLASVASATRLAARGTPAGPPAGSLPAPARAKPAAPALIG